jgi:2-polyprenyl-6-methoxyphenol hydroxylase-like FAD-dependent oxidoreductase
VLQLWPRAAPFVEPIADIDQLVFAQYDHFTARTPYSDRLVHIGDAARATSPQLGQGANMALLDALALARALSTHPPLAHALASYARMRYWHVRLFQWASSVFTPFYQSDSRVLPIVRDWFAAPLSRLPIADAILARLVSGMTTAALARSDFSPMRMSSIAHE